MAKIHLYGAKYYHHYIHNEYEQSVFFNEKVIRLWESMDDKQLESYAYLLAWNNLLLACNKGKMKEKGEHYYQEYLQLPQKLSSLFDGMPMRLQSPYYFTGYCYRAVSAITHRTYKQIEQIEKKLETHLKQFAEHFTWPTIIAGTLIQMTLASLILKKYSRAGFWLSKLKDVPSNNPKFLAESQLLELMILYDEESKILLNSRITSLKRKWKKDKPASAYALFIFDAIHKVTLKSSQDKLPEIWENIYQEVLKMEAESKSIILVSRWIEQKIS